MQTKTTTTTKHTKNNKKGNKKKIHEKYTYLCMYTPLCSLIDLILCEWHFPFFHHYSHKILFIRNMTREKKTHKKKMKKKSKNNILLSKLKSYDIMLMHFEITSWLLYAMNKNRRTVLHFYCSVCGFLNCFMQDNGSLYVVCSYQLVLRW